MPRGYLSPLVFRISTLLALAIIFTCPAFGQIVYNFRGTPDAAGPVSPLLADGAGNFYGTTDAGGTFGYGSIYELPASGGDRVLYSFTGGADGANPSGKMLSDGSGNFFGTASRGGNDSGNCAYFNGCGVVWQLLPSGSLRVLHTFTGGADGAEPLGGLVRGAAGVFYGTAVFGGTNSGDCAPQTDEPIGGCGVAFQIERERTYSVLHTFTGGSDGQFPNSSVARDAAGNLYGTISYGGGSTSAECTSLEFKGCGVVYKIDPSEQESVLHVFSGSPDGAFAEAGLIPDPDGNVYGTTVRGGTADYGSVYKVDASGNETVLYSFTGGNDGAMPLAGLIRDGLGNLYGTTTLGPNPGHPCGATCGGVFRLTPRGKEIVLYKFRGYFQPYAEMIFHGGFLYGTTEEGGNRNSGIVFKVEP